jgi:hypothetical protein
MVTLLLLVSRGRLDLRKPRDKIAISSDSDIKALVPVATKRNAVNYAIGSFGRMRRDWIDR